MKGYLQRLVRTVTNPVESVHPWVGSVVAASHQDGLNVVQTEEFTPVTTARQSPEVMAQASAQSCQPLAPTETLPPNPERHSTILELQATQILDDFTQTGRSAIRGPSLSERNIFEPLISDTERLAPEGLDGTEPDLTPVQEPEAAVPPRGRRSLADAQAVIKPGHTRQLTPGPEPAPTEKKDARPVRDSVAVDRGVDEIQIHIGRIEVTAIHPPPPTGSKARDAGISLDAYLKRRDGRAG
ncbi:MAG: hypothetical protein CV088_02650 [Nitrospira sp. LK70]|nr:hypothetical protein [Nitrospira sp. LK70]